MRLPKPFYRLPVRFDAGRLRAEIASMAQSAWAAHPNEIEGNSSLRLITVNGGDNDEVDGPMLPTPHLRNAPYIRQVLASFGVVWSRSRLMRLEPHGSVPEHADINYHWFNRVRLHIPVVTQPEVRFHCGGECVHMAAGEAWIFDNWRLHHVENGSDQERIHLVADTTGSAAFWQFVAQSAANDTAAAREFSFDPSRDVMPLTEQLTPPVVMPPAELELLVLDLRTELVLRDDTADGRVHLLQYHRMLDALSRDWRQLYLLHGEKESGWGEYTKLRDSIREVSRALGEQLQARTNGVAAHTVLEGRLLRHLLHVPGNGAARPVAAPSIRTKRARPELRQPVFIVAAPRSGSTLLFETLAVTPQFATLGGEAHWLIEDMPEFRPGAPGVSSNRLTAAQCTNEVAQLMTDRVLHRLQDANGRPIADATALRLLEKTPKNALRIPFIDAAFADARYIFLWRDPRENLASIIEAWRSGNWTTYRRLDGWEGAWSLLLPPGWRSMEGKTPEEIAAFQWESANRIALDDLESLPKDRWTALQYSDLVRHPSKTMRPLCEFLGIEFDTPLHKRVSEPLPLSRYTLTAPGANKWRRHEEPILRVLPTLRETWHRLQALAR